MPLTTSSVLDLAPDASSRKSGQDLAKAAKWQTLGCDGSVSWGEIKGSGASPYRTMVDVNGAAPAYKCSCPSRKFPCKHGLGLMLIQAGDPASVKASVQPEWVSSWVTGRASRAAAAENPKPVDEKAQARRRAARADRIDAGVAELGLWMGDLARRGIASAKGEPYDFWDRMGARLVDAQAPGLARRVRELGSLVSVPGAPVVEEIARLHLLTAAWTRMETLDEDLRADLRAAAGVPVAAEELAACPGVADTWTVLAHRLEDADDRLRSRECWLVGRDTGRFAKLLDFAAGDRPMPPAAPPGQAFAGTLAFHPGAAGLRAAVRGEAVPCKPPLLTGMGVAEALERIADAVARVPWTEEVPVALSPVRFGRAGLALAVGDASGALPLAGSDLNLPFACAAGGGDAVAFGTWDGRSLRLLAVQSGGRLHVPPVRPDATYARTAA